MNSLDGKKILITGAASGIGRATCLLAASKGASIVAADNAETVHAMVADLKKGGAEAVAVEADISIEADVVSCIEKCVDQFGRIDGIFANAGVIGAKKPFSELTTEDWHRTLGINTVGTFLCIKHAARRFLQQGHGAIVCTASVAGLRANAGGVDYSASKAAVISMVQTVAYELYGSGIRINGICPGLVETGMTASVFERVRELGKESLIGQVNPTARAGLVEEIAEMACFLLSDAASYVNGQSIAVDGGLSASHPWSYPRGK